METEKEVLENDLYVMLYTKDTKLNGWGLGKLLGLKSACSILQVQLMIFDELLSKRLAIYFK